MTSKTTEGQLWSPRVVGRLLVGFGVMIAMVLALAFLLAQDRKTRVRYTKWCEDRGYEYVGGGKYSSRYCRDRSTGKLITPPDLHLDSVSKREGVL